MIYKMFNGHHIDLSHILEISPAVFIDRMGCGGYYVGFYIQFILRDAPIWYEFNLSHAGDGARFIPEGFELYKYENNTYISLPPEEVSAACLPLLQKEVDKIVEEWKKFKESTPQSNS